MTKKSQVRIISGTLRGRKLHFPSLPRLRPTPDRVRETLFNWLSPDLPGAVCLDLFAGSGALGFEALSRQAQSVTFVEDSPLLVRYLTLHVKTFALEDKAHIYSLRFPFKASQLFTENKPVFDIVFLDPPFHQGLLTTASQWLIKERLLAPQCLIYIETELNLENLILPKNWELRSHNKAGQVRYGLIKAISY